MATARLHDGRLVDTTSEDFRHECEAKMLMGLPDLATRREWLEKIAQKRGTADRERLERTISAIRLHEQAARIISLPDRAARLEYLDEVEYQQGGAARRELERKARELWDARKAKASLQ